MEEAVHYVAEPYQQPRDPNVDSRGNGHGYRENDETGYEADEEAQEDEPCFFIDVKGEPLWLNDDDFSDDDESFTW